LRIFYFWYGQKNLLRKKNEQKKNPFKGTRKYGFIKTQRKQQKQENLPLHQKHPSKVMAKEPGVQISVAGLLFSIITKNMIYQLSTQKKKLKVRKRRNRTMERLFEPPTNKLVQV
jgi:hypothetical protein